MSELTLISDPSQIPEFEDDNAEADFWATHGLQASLMTRAHAQELTDVLPPARARKNGALPGAPDPQQR